MESGPSNQRKTSIIEDSLSAFGIFSTKDVTELTF